jgi:hypothetical protein
LERDQANCGLRASDAANSCTLTRHGSDGRLDPVGDGAMDFCAIVVLGCWGLAMRTVRGNLTVGLVLLLLCGSAVAQGAGRTGSDSFGAPGAWKQLAKLTEASGKSQDWLGWSVAVSKDGSTVAVGAVGWCPQQGFDGCGQGAIFVFVKPTSGWTDMTETAMLLASDGQPGEYLGESIAISDDGSTIIAGAPYWPANGNDDGAAYVFVRPQGRWTNATETARLTSTDGANVNLGDAVALSGNTIVAGGEYFNTDQGAAYVFVEPTGGWKNMTQTARLIPSDGKGGNMGWSISIDGDTVVAGAPITGIGSAGNGAYVFVKPTTGWKNRTETAKLTASRGTGFELGRAVSISGSTIAVGAPARRVDNGAVYVYLKPARGWRSMTQTAMLTVPPKYNSLGYSVSLNSDGKSIIAGDPGWQDGGGNGAVVLFAKPMTGWRTTSNFKARLTAADGRNMDDLGYSVSAAPAMITAGAPFARIGSSREQGAAYVFGQ